MSETIQIVTHECGRAILAPAPVDELLALSKLWKTQGFKFMSSSIAERLGAAIAVVRDEAGEKKWQSEIGIDFDGPDWLLSGDTGTSSMTIYSVMSGRGSPRGGRGDAPYDPADFGRCYRLLKRYPEWVPKLQRVADAYPIWRGLVTHWQELCSLYESEANPDAKGFGTGRAPKLYEMIRRLRKESEIAKAAAV